MPSIADNHRNWNSDYQWEGDGEEWSSWWGTSASQWRWSLLPRLYGLVPTGTVLEIAPGFGRWTRYLKELCDQLILVDLSSKCISACRKRFEGERHLQYHVNDGTSLSMVPDRSVDLLFSFDSLVHADAGVLRAYISQFAQKLKPGGAGFVHHSNAGMYRRYFAVADLVPKGPHDVIPRGLVKLGVLDPGGHWRDREMSAVLFRRFCEESGLTCTSQELVNWGTRRLIDCISTFVAPGSSIAGPTRVLRNRDFMREAAYVARVSGLAAHHEYPATVR